MCLEEKDTQEFNVECTAHVTVVSGFELDINF